MIGDSVLFSKYNLLMKYTLIVIIRDLSDSNPHTVSLDTQTTVSALTIRSPIADPTAYAVTRL